MLVLNENTTGNTLTPYGFIESYGGSNTIESHLQYLEYVVS
jgi:hypothetical protein